MTLGNINANMKVSDQCRITVSKSNQIIGIIRRNITYKEKGLIVPLYKAIVRPHLEYCIHAWRLYLRKDIDTLEKYKGEGGKRGMEGWREGTRAKPGNQLVDV